MLQRISHYALIALALISSSIAFSQKKVIDHTAYNDWKRIGEIMLSPNGEYSAYSINPFKGDGYLYLVNNTTGAKDSIARGKAPQFSHDGSLLIFKIAPQQAALRKAELDKQKKDKWPKDSLAIWFVGTDSISKYPNLKMVKVAEQSNVIAFTTLRNNLLTEQLHGKAYSKMIKELGSYYPNFGIKKTEAIPSIRNYTLNRVWKKPKCTFTSDGTLLTVLDFTNNRTVKFANVTDFELSKTGSEIGFTEHRKMKNLTTEFRDSVRLFVYSSALHTTWYDHSSYTSFSGLNFSDDGQSLVGLVSNDTIENRNWALITYDVASGNKQILIDSTQDFEGTRALSSNFSPYFINNKKDILFGVWDKGDFPAKDTLLESEKVKLDVWHWKDDRIQPEQLVQLKSDEERSNLYSYHVDRKTFTQIGKDSLNVRISDDRIVNTYLASTDKPYRSRNWESPNAEDVYLIDAETGQPTLILKENHFDVSLSPSGNFLAYFNDQKQQYEVRNLKENTVMCATCGMKTNIMSDLNGMPSMNGPLGIIGWTAGEKELLIQAERDIICFEFDKRSARSITDFFRNDPKDTNFAYSIYNLNNDSTLYYADNCALTRFNKTTKAMEVYRVSGKFPLLTYTLIEGSNHNYVAFKKAEKANTIVYQKHSNTDYPDLYVSNKVGEGSKQLSVTNPQQSEYNWSTVELIKWNSYSGIPLEGLLYKPEDYDPAKSYPLLVYFYEMYSDELHNHYAPKPTASIIYPTEYASAGYVVLIPDIRYTPGHPAKSAYDCIMSGTDAVLKQHPNVDSTRMGLQGQSWGGYQTAQLITMTKRYKAAMAGAPVSNMFSAYGGIRWGSGYSRQFQYEHTQSRIGKTIWEAPELYVENSPLFHLPKVETPLLIMANDKDGAVPWYQGIELYMGLRRLSKPVWLFNYNEDDHNLMKTANRIDLSIRMRQYFDHYLLNATAPNWLESGVPALDKGNGIQFDITK